MNVDDLAEMAQAYRNEEAGFSHEVRVCMAASCQSSGAIPVLEALDKAYSDSAVGTPDKAGHRCKVKGVGCMGLCSAGPLVAVAEQGSDLAGSVLYRDVKPERCPTDQPFFARQQRVVLENSGVIDPDSLHGYIAAGGYAALVRALSEMTPPEVVQEVIASGLRGRGGGGYPTGLKWSTVSKMVDHQKYVVCNADEGDPGAFMDRSVLESDPHRVLEGMAIAGYAVGANKGYIYVRAEYPLAIERLTTAIREAKRMGFLGHGGRDATSPSRSRSASAPAPSSAAKRPRCWLPSKASAGPAAPAPAVSGRKRALGQPTLINNVETFANIAPIMRKGGKWFAAIGTPKSKGTKVFALAGTIATPASSRCRWAPAARHRRRVIGGGIPGGKAFKAVQTGGPSGGCIPEPAPRRAGGLRVSLKSLGSMMGSGGMIVMDETTAWWTWRATSWSSAWTSPAASACPAGPARSRCTACWTASPTARAAARTWRCWKNSARWCRPPACAGWGSRRPTRCSARCASSVTSTSAAEGARPLIASIPELRMPLPTAPPGVRVVTLEIDGVGFPPAPTTPSWRSAARTASPSPACATWMA
jgi:bidirectional [NiFe] hydrogenase diaphorase subunit